MARIDDLGDLRTGLIARMDACESDQNYAVLGRLLADVVKQIDELDPPVVKPKGSPLDEFTARRQGREGAGTPDPDAERSTRARAAARRRR